jgi:acyl-CoA thioester hydrolase
VTFTYTHSVRFHEVDLQGYLFNSRYLEIADSAFVEFLQHLGFPYLELMKDGRSPSVVTATLKFERPARFEDVLAVDVDCLRVGSSSFDIRTSFVRDGSTVATTDLVYVNVHAASGRSWPLPDDVAAALRAQIP